MLGDLAYNDEGYSMASAHEIAADVLRVFGANVVARRDPVTYGHYAKAVGRDPTEYGVAIGKAMHAIGAYCVIKQIPVAPLYWVRRKDGGHRGVFENNADESRHILDSGDIETMYVVSREYHYKSEDFQLIEQSLSKSLASGGLTELSPHEIWRETFVQYCEKSSVTYYQRAMARYRELYDELKRRRALSR